MNTRPIPRQTLPRVYSAEEIANSTEQQRFIYSEYPNICQTEDRDDLRRRLQPQNGWRKVAT